jgi:pilus assembly protein Flp/PilA
MAFIRPRKWANLPKGDWAMRRLLTILRDERGATAVEYGLILALIFLAMIAGVSQFSQTTINMWNGVSTAVRGNA